MQRALADGLPNTSAIPTTTTTAVAAATTFASTTTTTTDFTTDDQKGACLLLAGPDAVRKRALLPCVRPPQATPVPPLLHMQKVGVLCTVRADATRKGIVGGESVGGMCGW